MFQGRRMVKFADGYLPCASCSSLEEIRPLSIWVRSPLDSMCNTEMLRSGRQWTSAISLEQATPPLSTHILAFV